MSAFVSSVLILATVPGVGGGDCLREQRAVCQTVLGGWEAALTPSRGDVPGALQAVPVKPSFLFAVRRRGSATSTARGVPGPDSKLPSSSVLHSYFFIYFLNEWE